MTSPTHSYADPKDAKPYKASVEQVHEEKETLAVDINIPGHEARTETSLFASSKRKLIQLLGDEARCYICNCTAAEAGAPLEAHHHPVERSLANLIDWDRFRNSPEAQLLAPGFDWSKFDPADPMSFVDDMTVNGLLLCKKHHTGKDEGIHMLPYPLWIAQKYAKEGYQFSAVEVIHHAT